MIIYLYIYIIIYKGGFFVSDRSKVLISAQVGAAVKQEAMKVIQAENTTLTDLISTMLEDIARNKRIAPYYLPLSLEATDWHVYYVQSLEETPSFILARTEKDARALEHFMELREDQDIQVEELFTLTIEQKHSIAAAVESEGGLPCYVMPSVMSALGFHKAYLHVGQDEGYISWRSYFGSIKANKCSTSSFDHLCTFIRKAPEGFDEQTELASYREAKYANTDRH